MKSPAPQDERTFFITAVAHLRKPLFRNAERAALLVDVLEKQRAASRFLLHAFVVMPDHAHVLFTPAEDVSLEKAVQFIKGGYSFRVKKEFGYAGEVWQQSFTEHRVKDAADYQQHVNYIHQNPVRARLVREAEEYPYSSAAGKGACGGCPPWVKPVGKGAQTRG